MRIFFIPYKTSHFSHRVITFLERETNNINKVVQKKLCSKILSRLSKKRTEWRKDFSAVSIACWRNPEKITQHLRIREASLWRVYAHICYVTGLKLSSPSVLFLAKTIYSFLATICSSIYPSVSISWWFEWWTEWVKNCKNHQPRFFKRWIALSTKQTATTFIYNIHSFIKCTEVYLHCSRIGLTYWRRFSIKLCEQLVS